MLAERARFPRYYHVIFPVLKQVCIQGPQVHNTHRTRDNLDFTVISHIVIVDLSTK